MINVDKIKCTGCTACMNICPKNAISMIKNSEGFNYPIIDKEKCIDCNLCKKVCPLNKTSNPSINKCYLGFNNNNNVLLKSSSGGMFSLIADYILDNNGVVIGASFNDNKLNHIAIEKRQNLNKLRGSKYLQSNLDDIFKDIKIFTKKRKVLFVGTPCQVAGVKSFIGTNDNLICIDIICHGVPSPMLFDKYIKELEGTNEKVLNYNFRDKSTGWDSYSNTVTFKNSKSSELATNNNYMKLFLSNIALRESCYDCNFKIGNKYSDITLGDFWGVKKYYPEMYNKNGVSAIIINTELGNVIFNNIKDNITYHKCKLEEIITGNSSLKISSNRPTSRNSFFNDLNKLTIKELRNKYVKKEILYKRIIEKCKKIIKKIETN